MKFPFPRKTNYKSSGFSLVELLVVIAIMAAMMAMLIPAFTSLNNAGNVTTASYTVKAALDEARAYAMANNTYVWVGFYEENATQGSTTPATSGTGRIVLSIVASKDGTMIYNNPPNSLPISSGSMTASLSQINKLVKIDNMHLQTFSAGSGTGMDFATRPKVSGTAAQIGAAMLLSGSSQAPFRYPVGNPAPTAQYTFTTALQFSPRGEVRLNEASNPLQTIVEIGLQPTHGTVVDARNQNVAAVQITGIAGEATIFRQ